MFSSSNEKRSSSVFVAGEGKDGRDLLAMKILLPFKILLQIVVKVRGTHIFSTWLDTTDTNGWQDARARSFKELY